MTSVWWLSLHRLMTPSCVELWQDMSLSCVELATLKVHKLCYSRDCRVSGCSMNVWQRKGWVLLCAVPRSCCCCCCCCCVQLLACFSVLRGWGNNFIIFTHCVLVCVCVCVCVRLSYVCPPFQLWARWPIFMNLNMNVMPFDALSAYTFQFTATHKIMTRVTHEFVWETYNLGFWNYVW